MSPERDDRYRLPVIPLGVLVTLASIIFAAGVWVGAYNTDVLAERLRAHEAIDVHNGAVRASVYAAEQRELRARIMMLERFLESAQDRLASLERRMERIAP